MKDRYACPVLGQDEVDERQANMIDDASVRENWRQRGFSCDIWTDPPGQVWRDFVHGTDELVMLIEGEIEVSVAGKTWRPAVGEEVFIPAGASHTVVNVGATRNRWYYGYRHGA